MEMCEPCSSIEVDRRGAPGHAALEETGARRGNSPIGQSRVGVTEYVCRTCSQRWEYEDDKNDRHAGWSRVG